VLETAYLYRGIQLYHFVILMFDFLCDMLFTEINDDDDDDNNICSMSVCLD